MTVDGQRLGLALSGGGYRAALFGLGSLWRLNDGGLLGRLDRITGVSGGAIAAGVLAHRWRRLTFENGRATNFATEVAEPIQEFCTRSIDIKAGLLGILTPFRSASDYLQSYYEKFLFGPTLLRELPEVAGGHPEFIFYATNMQTGRSFRFRQKSLADWMLGEVASGDVKLATAIAASSAFPPVFSPVIVRPQGKWSGGKVVRDKARLRARLVLADGGIYDNLGLQALLRNIDVILVSDAGAPFGIQPTLPTNYFSQLGRVRNILIDQTRALRKGRLMDDFATARKRGAYWGITSRIEKYEDPQSAFKDTPATAALSEVGTRLKKFDHHIRGRLVNWGYVLCDAALRTRTQLPTLPSTSLPLPQWPLD